MTFCQYPEIIVNRLSIQQGLADNSIRCIMQDHMGFIWIGGDNGLYKYDGYSCTFFKSPPGCENCPLFKKVFAICEDTLGLIWILSDIGITLLDPEKEKSILVYPFSKDFPLGRLSLKSNMLLDFSGNIWASNLTGLVRLSYKRTNSLPITKETIFKHGAKDVYSIEFFQLSAQKYGTDNSVISLYEDKQRNIWVGCVNGLYILRHGTQKFVRLDQGANKGTQQPIMLINDILQINEDEYWIAALNGLYLLTNVKIALSDSIPNNSLLLFSLKQIKGGQSGTSLLIGRYKTFLLGTYNDELFTIKREEETGEITYESIYQGLRIQQELYHTKNEVYTGNAVQEIFEDRSGVLWVGHVYYGIIKFNLNQSQFTSYNNLVINDFHGNDINSIFKDNIGNLWIGTFGGGLYKIAQESNKVTIYDLGFPKNFIICMQESSPGIFWIGLYTGILEFNTYSGKFRDPLPNNRIANNLRNSTVMDLKKVGKEIYIATMRGVFVYNYNNKQLYQFSFDKDDSSDNMINTVVSFVKMKNGEMWASTSYHGITKVEFNSENGSLYLKPIITRQTLLDNGFEITGRHRLYEDSKGLLWIVDNSGLHRINEKTGEVKNYQLFENIDFPEVWSIIEDDHENLWLGTHYGLCRFDMKNEKVKVFENENGVPILIHGMNSVFKEKEGRLYFGGIGGFYSFHPDSLLMNNYIPPVVITDFRLFNKSIKVDNSKKGILDRNISYTKRIKLAYNQNDIAFTFAALDFNQPLKNEYAYILEGYQDDWTKTGANNRTATYTNLNPGKYVFRVKGSNNDGVWNEEGAFINVIIHPPFWKTTLAYIAYAVLFLMLLRGYVYLRTRSLRKEKVILEKQVNERTAELKTANTQLEEHQKEIEEVNTLLEEQKEELMQQKEELQSTLENLQKAQEQLVESEKMAAVGGLVAGVAHEINTPVGIGITAISNLLEDVQQMAKLYEKDEVSRKDFKGFLESTNDTAKLIHKNLERTAELIQSFKQVSTDQITEQQRLFALKDYLNDILLSLRPKFRGKNITFNMACDDELQLNSYPGVYAQIFTNLLLNSLQHGFYKKDTGTITIKANINKELLKIQYSDDGAGISKNNLPHIFEPFFTSDQHRGTGLGLNIIYNLIKQKLHGTIICESEPGKGVLFKIEVPVK